MIDEGSRARLQITTRPKSIKELEVEIDKITHEKEAAIRRQEYERAASLRDKERQLISEREDKLRDWEKKRDSAEMVVNEEDIAYIVSKWTGIPLTKLEESESFRLLRMRDELHKAVIGQESAIDAVTRAIQRSRASAQHAPPRRVLPVPWPDRRRQTACENAGLVSFRQRRSAHHHRHERVWKSSPCPAWRRARDTSGITRRRSNRPPPYSVVLFDEIEKRTRTYSTSPASPRDGHMTDSTGRKVVPHTVIVMTSSGPPVGRKYGSALPDNKATNTRKCSPGHGRSEKVFVPVRDELVVFHRLTRRACGPLTYTWRK